MERQVFSKVFFKSFLYKEGTGKNNCDEIYLQWKGWDITFNFTQKFLELFRRRAL